MEVKQLYKKYLNKLESAIILPLTSLRKNVILNNLFQTSFINRKCL